MLTANPSLVTSPLIEISATNFFAEDGVTLNATGNLKIVARTVNNDALISAQDVTVATELSDIVGNLSIFGGGTVIADRINISAPGTISAHQERFDGHVIVAGRGDLSIITDAGNLMIDSANTTKGNINVVTGSGVLSVATSNAPPGLPNIITSEGNIVLQNTASNGVIELHNGTLVSLKPRSNASSRTIESQATSEMNGLVSTLRFANTCRRRTKSTPNGHRSAYSIGRRKSDQQRSN